MEAGSDTVWGAGGHLFTICQARPTERGSAPAPAQIRPRFPVRATMPTGFAPKMPICSGFIQSNAIWFDPADDRADASAKAGRRNEEQNGSNKAQPPQRQNYQTTASPMTKAAIRALLLQGVLSLLLLFCFAGMLQTTPPASAGLEQHWAEQNWPEQQWPKQQWTDQRRAVDIPAAPGMRARPAWLAARGKAPSMPQHARSIAVENNPARFISKSAQTFLDFLR